MKRAFPFPFPFPFPLTCFTHDNCPNSLELANLEWRKDDKLAVSTHARLGDEQIHRHLPRKHVLSKRMGPKTTQKKNVYHANANITHTTAHTHTHKYKRTHTQTQTRTRTNAQTHTRTMKTSNSSKHLNGHSITSHSAMRNESVEYDFSPPVAFATTRNACLGVEVEAANGEGGNKQTKRSFNISEPLVPLETVCIRT